MSYLGDYSTGTVIYGKFTTFRPSTSTPYTLAGTPAVSVYKDNSTTQSTTGVTLTVDFDSLTGLNHVAIDTSADGTFYSAGSNFDIVITTGTVDSVSVVGAVVLRFSLDKDSALKPTTAGRKLDVSAGGEAGVDWANVGSPTTTQTLSGTTIKTATDVETDTADIQTRLPAALQGGRMDASVGAMANNVMTAAAAAADLTTELQSGLATASALATLQTTADDILTDTGTTLPATLSTIAGYIDTEIGTIITNIAALNNLSQADIRTAIGLASANLDTQLAALPTATENATGLLDLANGIETGYTLREVQRLLASVMLSKVSGAGTGTEVFRDVNDTKNRVTSTVDTNGNRTAVTLDAT